VNFAAMNQRTRILLGVLGVLALFAIYENFLSGPSSTPASAPGEVDRSAALAPPVIGEPGPAAAGGPAAIPRVLSGSRGGRSDEFHPVLKSKRPEDRINPIDIDPTLRVDLLAKLQTVASAGSGRNLFAMGQPPVKDAVKLAGAEPVVRVQPPPPPPPPPPVDTGPPPPPPINLKYYGLVTTRDNGVKTAFFQDGDDILMAAEGATVKGRYKVVRIGANSVVMEDVQSKRQQTLPLTEQAVG
jgi:hypothetical protein